MLKVLSVIGTRPEAIKMCPLIKEMEKNAKMSQEDKGDFLEVKILLPKSDRCFT